MGEEEEALIVLLLHNGAINLFKLFFMSNEPNSVTETGDTFLIRMLVKTAIKAVIWCVMAGVITYFWPHAGWVWYVVCAFVAVGVTFGLAGRYFANRAARKR